LQIVSMLPNTQQVRLAYAFFLAAAVIGAAL
jgi:hypothetical protein